MITVFCAMYAEAAMLISHYGLKQNHNITNFSVFENEDVPVRVMLTGVGEIKSAAAVGAAGILFPPKSEDLFLNFGVCKGAGADKEKLFLINKVTEQATGRTFYPDLLIQTELAENSLVTVSGVLNETETVSAKNELLYDMEAAAIYQAGSIYAGPHQLSFLKLVSDSGETVAAKEISAMILQRENEICGYIDRMLKFASKHLKTEFEWDPLLLQMKNALTKSLHCSDYMEKELSSLLAYVQVSKKKLEWSDPVFAECKNRREGKVLLDEFRTSLTK